MHFATAHSPKKPTLLSVTAASLYLALFFTVSSVLQLFAFEAYPDVIESYDIPLVSDASLFIAAVIVSLEVLAIPFLLWIKLSPPMRIISFLSGWAVLLYWLSIGLWQSIADVTIGNAGLFGAKILLPQGWWLVSYSAVLLILMAYVSWDSHMHGFRKKD